MTTRTLTRAEYNAARNEAVSEGFYCVILFICAVGAGAFLAVGLMA